MIFFFFSPYLISGTTESKSHELMRLINEKCSSDTILLFAFDGARALLANDEVNFRTIRNRLHYLAYTHYKYVTCYIYYIIYKFLYSLYKTDCNLWVCVLSFQIRWQYSQILQLLQKMIPAIDLKQQIGTQIRSST